MRKKSTKKVTKKAVKKSSKKVAKKSTKKVSSEGPKERKPRSSFKLEKVEHHKFPELVIVSKAPSWAKSAVGKRYVNEEFANKMIHSLLAEKIIKTGEKAVKKEIKGVLGHGLEE